MKQFQKISQAQIERKGVQALSTRPNNASRNGGQGGLSAEELKRWFDNAFKILSEAHNKLLSILQESEGADHIGAYIATGETSMQVSLQDILNSLASGAAATYLMLYPHAGGEAEKESLQNIIFALARTIASEKEITDGLRRGDYNGSTFIPDVSPDGVISWTNNGGFPNPNPVNILKKSGCFPLLHLPYASQITVPVNTEVHIGETEGDMEILLSPADTQFSSEWDLFIKQGEHAYNIVFPTLRWDFGFAPTFDANTTTICRLYYVEDVLHGDWVTK